MISISSQALRATFYSLTAWIWLFPILYKWKPLGISFFNDPSWFNLLEDRASGWIAAGRGTQPNIEPNPNFTLVILQPPADMTQQMKIRTTKRTKKVISSGHQRGGHYCAWRLKFPKSRTIEGGIGENSSLAAFFLVALSCTTVGKYLRKAHQTCPHLLCDGLGLGWGSWCKPLPAH